MKQMHKSGVATSTLRLAKLYLTFAVCSLLLHFLIARLKLARIITVDTPVLVVSRTGFLSHDSGQASV